MALIAASPSSAVAQERISAAERREAIDALAAQLAHTYVFPDVAERMIATLRAREAAGAYAGIGDGDSLARQLTDDLRKVSKDGHLEVEYSKQELRDGAVEAPSAAEIEAFRQASARRNFEWHKVERLDGGVGLLQVDGFHQADWIATPALGAMSFLANSDAIILDLRWNSGGAPDGVILTESYFFDQPVHITDQYDRAAGTTHQYWTMPVVPGPSLAKKDLYVLVSHRSFSAAEDFAYNMQALGRAKIVGETTGGGAHGTRPFRLSAHFQANIPFSRSINPVTGGDWEGVGVKPDIEVPADEALLVAHVAALRGILARQKDAARAAEIGKLIEQKNEELKALRAKR